jgi:hypothetical protein
MMGIFKKRVSDKDISDELIAEADAKIQSKLAPLAPPQGMTRQRAEEIMERRLADEADASRSAAQRARRKPRDKVRNVQMNLKISREEQLRLQRLQTQFDCSFADLMVNALDALEAQGATK